MAIIAISMDVLTAPTTAVTEGITGSRTNTTITIVRIRIIIGAIIVDMGLMKTRVFMGMSGLIGARVGPTILPRGDRRTITSAVRTPVGVEAIRNPILTVKIGETGTKMMLIDTTGMAIIKMPAGTAIKGIRNITGIQMVIPPGMKEMKGGITETTVLKADIRSRPETV